MNLKRILPVAWLLLAAGQLPAGTKFEVSFDSSVRPDTATGRLVVYLHDQKQGSRGSPASGFVEEDPQPMFGIDVNDLKPGESAVVDDSATSFPVVLSKLPPGKYRAQAVLDMKHQDSNWRREEGNLSSKVVDVTIKEGEDQSVKLDLVDVVKPRTYENRPGVVELFEIKSKLLSEFHNRDVLLRCGVVFPQDYNPGRKYSAVYEVPGFGGNHSSAFREAQRGANPDSPMGQLRRNAFQIVLDPESPNGHTLFADSDNNGPCGRALTEELIPALEAKYPLHAKPEARIVRGHSSGGWSSLWLQLTYPNVFGACWTSSPDPIDFRKFEQVDIYTADNMYVGADGKDVFGGWFDGKETMTVRQENGMEQVLGPGNSQGQQWDSWLAVWGTRNPDGSIRDLYDPITGKIDHKEAETYKRYDIGYLLRTQPDKFAPIFRQRVRLTVGDQDNYYLNEAVVLVRDDLAKIPKGELPEGENGYIKIVPGTDHGSVFGSPAMRAIPAEMVEHLKRNKLLVQGPF